MRDIKQLFAMLIFFILIVLNLKIGVMMTMKRRSISSFILHAYPLPNLCL